MLEELVAEVLVDVVLFQERKALHGRVPLERRTGADSKKQEAPLVVGLEASVGLKAWRGVFGVTFPRVTLWVSQRAIYCNLLHYSC